MLARSRTILIAALGLGGGACSVDISGGPSLSGDPGRVALHRLNRAEYNNTVRDLLGTQQRPADAFPNDDYAHGFDNIADVQTVSPLQTELYQRAAEALAVEATTPPEGGANAEPYGRVMTCQPDAAAPQACAEQIARALARKAWRRPVTDDEIAGLVALVAVAAEQGEGPERGIRLMVEAILASPNFIYRFELDPRPESTTPRALDDHELATRLSYFLWSSMPDDELSLLADDGALVQPDEIALQVERMLADPKADQFVENFTGQWLTLRGLHTHEPDVEVFPDYDTDLGDDMLAETRAFFREFLSADRPIRDMLTADFAHLTPRLAAHYGVAHPGGDGMARVTLPPERRGLLGQGAFLTYTSNPTRTSPVKRGKWVLEQLMCDAPDPPPPGTEGLAEEVDQSAPLRQRMEQHRANEVCASCHKVMDPIGFALEHFDGVGAWREMDGTFAIDATGQFPDGSTFDGATQLADVLAGDARFPRCLARKLATFALGRGIEEADERMLDRTLEDLAEHGDRLHDLVLLIATSEPFRYRRGEPAGGDL